VGAAASDVVVLVDVAGAVRTSASVPCRRTPVVTYSTAQAQCHVRNSKLHGGGGGWVRGVIVACLCALLHAYARQLPPARLVGLVAQSFCFEKDV
jgi:hypothetical protein